MPSADELRAALKVAELEEDLAKAKGTKAGAPRELKDKVRAARQEYREKYRSAPGGPGDGTATPAAVQGSAKVKVG